uniref:Uncharacterized protein n=1 Tax=Poecilia reticulata TaxID=8081 RepID=A0A3P9P562_POERE
MSIFLSKYSTSAGSVNSEASTCSKVIDQSASRALPRLSSPLTSTVSSAMSSHCGASTFLAPLPNFLPTSPMRSSRLATVAMAWYSCCSLGSSLNMLYSVLHSSMNCSCSQVHR